MGESARLWTRTVCSLLWMRKISNSGKMRMAVLKEKVCRWRSAATRDATCVSPRVTKRFPRFHFSPRAIWSLAVLTRKRKPAPSNQATSDIFRVNKLSKNRKKKGSWNNRGIGEWEERTGGVASGDAILFPLLFPLRYSHREQHTADRRNNCSFHRVDIIYKGK